MKIDTTILLPVAAVIASLLLLVAGIERLFEAVALIASAAWLLFALGMYKCRSITRTRRTTW